MPKFKIYGASADTGADTHAVVEAATPDEAEAIASHRRIMVARVVEVEQQIPAPPTRQQPIAHVTQSERPFVRTVEATGKRWKAVILIATLVTIVSFIVAMVNGLSDGSGMVTALGVFGVFIGLAAFIVGRIGAWWYHG